MHVAGLHELQDILSLQRSESNRVGFLPRTAILQHIERGWCLTANFNGDFIGYVLGWHRMRYDPLIRPVTQLIVARRFRRCGVARLLLEKYGERALSHGQKALQAWTRADLRDAQQMWRHLNWQPIAIRTPDTARGVPAVLFRKSLVRHAHASFTAIPTRGGWNAAAIDAISVDEWLARSAADATKVGDSDNGE